MEIKTDMAEMLEMMDRPAFFVSGGRIVQVNHAAAARMVPLGEPVLPLLQSGQEEYPAFSGGCLCLSLAVSGTNYNASVTKMEDADLFTLEPEDPSEELQPLALAARELREPLNAILSITDELFPRLDRGEDNDAADQMARVSRRLYQMLRLVNNMTTVSTPLPPQLELRDVTAVVQELFDQAEHLCAGSGIALHFTNHPATIYSLIDSHLLERGIYNILSNSLKYTPAGGTIDARLSRRGNQIHLVMKDSGPGIDSGILGTVYRRYLREPGLEPAGHGIGLGMKLVHNAATAHGGTVLMENLPSGGVRTTLSLPIRQRTNSLRSPALRIDHAGDRSPALIELSDCLPPELYAPYHSE